MILMKEPFILSKLSKRKKYSNWLWNYLRDVPLWEPPRDRTKLYPSDSRNNVYPFKWEHLRFWRSEEWKEIKQFLKERQELGYEVYPSFDLKYVFRPLLLTSFKETKIVIVGQDPYPQKGMADGLAFSVLPTVSKIPGSLGNILSEYREDLQFRYPRSGDLSYWARNGILLINTVWTIEGRPHKENKGDFRTRKSSHYKINGKQLWQELTAEIFQQLSKRKDKLVFILWGKSAQEWRYLIDETKHLVLVGAHPSPRNFTLTAKDGIKFFGGKYFSKACEYLDLPKTIWRLP